jgi:hypothetical protein
MLHNLDRIYRDQDRYIKAEGTLERTLAIYEKNFGPEHPYVRERFNSLGELYRAWGRYREPSRISSAP